ncbi:hypothetical protein KG112_07420 [Nocardioides sp. zg-ZUI104]|uniref:DUF6174 domain-containing protein n=1 Tax=Nocardioides faecalis TaxID=2803858 RepID=UPI001BCD1919|nr:DUF6174 domain-containing protein [Nocardioides faecalis]MBS4752637.1 hypothetical protein [Nocardioides faecalis]
MSRTTTSPTATPLLLSRRGARVPAPAVALAIMLVVVLGAAGCSRENDDARDATSASASTPASTPASPPASSAPGSEGSDATTPASPSGGPASRTFDERDYTYLLEVVCYCPPVGPVRVTVADGEVRDAVLTTGEPGAGAPGDQAPAHTRLSIQDILAEANDPAAADVRVDWPAAATHPDSVSIDRRAGVFDDEVTYRISDVRVSAG